MKQGFLHKLIEKLDRVGPEEVQTYLARFMEERGFLERVFDALQEGVIVLDRDGAITYLNSAACRLFGINREDSLGAAVSGKIRGLDWGALTSENKVISRDLEVFYPENRYLNFYLAPIRGDEDAVAPQTLGYVMIVRDITHDRRVEEEKIESEKLTALTMLAAGVAHEIGNPLNSLNIHLQLARRKLKQAPPELRDSIAEHLDVSLGEIKRLDFIVSQFLGAIRPRRPNLELTDINVLLEEAIRFLEPEFKDRRVQLKLNLQSPIPLLPLDRDELKQAIYNLARNAIQAIGTGGAVEIETVAEEYHVVIRVKDDGAGISAEDMGNIFQPYFTTKATGTGLGLLIVRRIVREHGGEIELESDEGKGTVVSLYFPRGGKQVRFLPAADESEAAAVAVAVAGEDETELSLESSSGDSVSGPKKAKGRVIE